jgi:hypothetical protein
MTADALALLFRRLVLAAQEAGALARPIEVSEILERLVPYRAARRDGLLDTNDDYLHAVMQLLAGERGYVFADDLMQDDLKNELTALNPDLGVLNTYRNAKVRIASTQAEQVLSGDISIDLRAPTPLSTEVVAPTAPPPAPAPRPAATPRPSTTPTEPRGVARASAEIAGQPVAPAAPTVVTPPAPQAPAVPVPPAPVDESVSAVCPYCSKDIATDRPLKYCPHCGINLRIRRCPGCSAEMEAEWKFCVTCGRSAP